MLLRRLRLVTGSVLFLYIATHLLNHALGLVSIEAMEDALLVQKALWQQPVGTALLYGSLGVHALLGLWALFERRYFRWSKVEAAQLTLGLAIPALLANHVAVTRASLAAFGLEKGYAQELYALWVAPGPWGVVQVAVLMVAWTHGVIGLRASMRLRSWYPAVAPYLLVAAVLVPVLALLGFEQGGRMVAALVTDPAWRAEALAVARVGTPAQKAAAADWRVIAMAVWATAIAAVLAARAARSWRETRRGLVSVAYPNGRTVRMARGLCVLDASRIGRVPHASVCGGRGRCSTCRVRVLGHPAAIPPPSIAEQIVLDRMQARSGSVRLACQLRPLGDISVLPLIAPAQARHHVARWRHAPSAEERFVVALFADMRGSTELSSRHLPFDNLFLLSTFIAALADAVARAGGVANQFMGDGILALFGTEGAASPQAACRQGLLACRMVAAAVDDFNATFGRDLNHPVGFGVGLHAGVAIVGEIGFGRHATTTALGEPVNVASRLQAATREHGCAALVSEAVLRGAGALVPELTEIAVRGYGPILARAFGAGELLEARTPAATAPV